MNDDTAEAPLVSWPREYFRPGGHPEAALSYQVFGRFPPELQISRSRHRTAGLPGAVTMKVIEAGPDSLPPELLPNHALRAVVEASPHRAVISGTVPESDVADYLRDVVGIVEALIEQGGAAVFDAQMLHWWQPRDFSEDVWAPNALQPARHVQVHVLTQPSNGLRWYHSYGMRKFGRPDLSVPDLSSDLAPVVENELPRVVHFLANGGLIRDGRPAMLDGLPDDSIFTYRPHDPNDPVLFLNDHYQLGPPRSGQ